MAATESGGRFLATCATLALASHTLIDRLRVRMCLSVSVRPPPERAAAVDRPRRAAPAPNTACRCDRVDDSSRSRVRCRASRHPFLSIFDPWRDRVVEVAHHRVDAGFQRRIRGDGLSLTSGDGLRLTSRYLAGLTVLAGAPNRARGRSCFLPGTENGVAADADRACDGAVRLHRVRDDGGLRPFARSHIGRVAMTGSLDQRLRIRNRPVQS